MGWRFLCDMIRAACVLYERCLLSLRCMQISDLILLLILCCSCIKTDSLDGGPRLISPLGTIKSLRVLL